jgi:hypothetical protein
MNPNPALASLCNEQLLSATREILRRACVVEADLLVHLAEIEERRLHLEMACSSMFAFCVMKLGFSEDATYNRLGVAHAGRHFPAILDALRSGEVHLSGLRVLVPRLTAENHCQLLARAAGKSKREIEELVAALAPKPPVPDVMRKLPRSARSETAQLALASATARRVEQPRAIAPLSEDTFKVQFTASRGLRDKLRQAQDLVRHRLPSGDLASIIESAVDLLIEKVKKERFAVGRKPRPDGKAKTAGPCPRPMPASVRRHVYVRDQGLCTFVDEFGNRCPETGMLEYDHIDGWARTHTHDPDRIRLRCHAHNQHAAEQMYGREFMERARLSRGDSSRPGEGRDASAPTVHATRADESAGASPL